MLKYQGKWKIIWLMKFASNYMYMTYLWSIFNNEICMTNMCFKDIFNSKMVYYNDKDNLMNSFSYIELILTE